MKLPGKNPGYGNRGKTNRVFPPFPQPLLLTINLDKKAADPKQQTIVYTKYLTLPKNLMARTSLRLILCVFLLALAQLSGLAQTRMPQLKYTDRTLANGLRVLSAP